MQTGTPKFNAVAVVEGTFSFVELGADLRCKAAFVSTVSGVTHGWTSGSGSVWSKNTVALLLELRKAMEEDLAKVHLFADDGASSGEEGPVQRSGQAPTGLGESLSGQEGDAPSV